MSKENGFGIIKPTLRFLLIILLQGILTIVWLLLIPKEPGAAGLWGYSYKRLALLLPVLFAIALAGLLRWELKKRTNWQTALMDERWRSEFSRIGILASFLLALASWSLVFFFHFFQLNKYIDVYFRLLPLLVYCFVIGSECILFIALVWLVGKKNKNAWGFKALFGKPFWIAFASLIVIWLIIELTGLGKAPEFISTISLGVPLLEGQIWFIAGLIVLVLCLAGSWSRLPQQAEKERKWNVDLLVCLALWVLAAVLWLSLPLPQHNYFAPDRLPPNYQIYPFSDAEQYDINSLWVWKGSIKDTVISKPLYVVFLSVLHALVGLDYDKVIFLQTLVLAILPPVIYLIGKEMHSRLGGQMLAMMVILREMNSIQAVNTANVSNSKLLLSDMPATLLVCILILVMIRWFKSPQEKVGMRPFIIGGIIGCLNLMRIQTMVLEVFAILTIIVHYRKSIKKILSACGIFTLALSLVLGPVLIRNHSITGVYWVDNPATSSSLYRVLSGCQRIRA